MLIEQIRQGMIWPVVQLMSCVSWTSGYHTASFKKKWSTENEQKSYKETWSANCSLACPSKQKERRERKRTDNESVAVKLTSSSLKLMREREWGEKYVRQRMFNSKQGQTFFLPTWSMWSLPVFFWKSHRPFQRRLEICSQLCRFFFLFCCRRVIWSLSHCPDERVYQIPDKKHFNSSNLSESISVTYNTLVTTHAQARTPMRATLCVYY